MSNKKKLVIEEYSEKLNFYKKTQILKIDFNRVAFIFFVFSVLFLVFTSKIIFIATKKIEKNVTHQNIKFRANIIDRNGNLLAKSVFTKNIGINPKEVIDKEKLLLNLKIIFPKKDYELISKKIDKGKFFYLEKQISQKKYNKIILLGDKAIKEEQKISRIYPQANLFSHVIGQIDDNNNGISGIEKYYDYELITSKDPIQLSLDANLQYLIREELSRAEDIFKNIGSASILMDINSGEILSLVSLPDYDLNKRQNINDIKFINRATKAVYELGSVFKTFTFAAGLNEGVIESNTFFENLESSIKCGRNRIGEYDDKIPKNLTAEEILIRSGNIGSVRIGQKLGIDKFKNFLIEIGIIDKIEFDIEEVGTPIPFIWGKCKLATSSFGHGITTTPLQLLNGYAILSNGGFKTHPTLIKQYNKNKNENKRILNYGVSKKVNSVLRKIVSSKDGTAGFANVEGYQVGGKTGTAQKSISGKYVDKKINTFVSIFPTSKPKFALLVLLDEPKANKEYIYNYRDGSGFKYKGNWRDTSGWTTVEVAGKIIEKIGPILATKYYDFY